MATQQQIDELIEKTTAERANLVAVVRSLSPGDERAVPVDAEGEEQWTALEQLAHLLEMETSYCAWVEAALGLDNPEIESVNVPMPPIRIEDAHKNTPAELVRQLDERREQTMALIARVTPEQFERTARSGTFGTLTVMQWLRSFYRHDRQHAAQIAGRVSDYQPRFKGKEPNQRQARIDLVKRSRSARSET